jgi:uncharacterized membrane protein
MNNNSLLILNLIALVGFVIHFLSNHAVSYELGKVGDKSKIKQLIVLLGVPLFTVLFIYAYLFNQSAPYGPKTLIEVLFIIFAYVELHEIESEAK